MLKIHHEIEETVNVVTWCTPAHVSFSNMDITWQLVWPNDKYRINNQGARGRRKLDRSKVSWLNPLQVWVKENFDGQPSNFEG